MRVGVGRREEVDAVCGRGLGCEVLADGVDFVVETVRKGVTEGLRGCDIVFGCSGAGELLGYIEKFLAAVGAVIDAGG